MGYIDWSSETDSTAVLGNLRDENPAQSVEGTVVNTAFMASQIGQKFVDIASVLGSNPNHASSNVYRAGGRGGFPLLQIPSDSGDVSNDANNRYCQIEEDIAELFENGDLGNGDQLLGTFRVVFEGADFRGEWYGLTAYQKQNGKYSVHIDRTAPNKTYGTLPLFSVSGSDSSAFEVGLEVAAGSGGGSGLAGNVSVFGPTGSGAEYTVWQTMLDAIEPSLDSTNQHMVLVMPGLYDVSSLPWKARPYYNAAGTLERYHQYKLYVPSYVHIAGLDEDSVVFNLDSTTLFRQQGTVSNNADSTNAGANPGLFLAAQFSSIRNLTIVVNQQIASPDPNFSMPSAIRFICDSSTPYLSDQTNVMYNELQSASGINSYESGNLLHKWLFSTENVTFRMLGWGNQNSAVFAGRSHVSAAAGFPTREIPGALYNPVNGKGVPINLSGATVYLKNCKIRDSVIRTNFYTTTYGGKTLLPYGDTLGIDFCNLMVDGLDYEYLRDVGPATGDSTHGFVVPGSQHFVVTYSGLTGVKKRFNNCRFSAPNMYSFSKDSTVHLFNKFSFSKVRYRRPTESIQKQYNDFPAVVTVNAVNTTTDVYKYFDGRIVQFNNCEFFISGKNHPQKGDYGYNPGTFSGAPFVDATDFASEFCVAVDEIGNLELEFNDCSFENRIDSPYSGLFVVGSNYDIKNESGIVQIGSIRLNRCKGESIGYGIVGVNNGIDYDVYSGFGVFMDSCRFTSYKSPIVKSTVGGIGTDATDLSPYCPIRLYAVDSEFNYSPFMYHVSSINRGNRTTAPLWVDTTSVGGVMQFDTTGDVGIFYRCSFNSIQVADLNLLNLPGFFAGLDYDFSANIKNGSYKYGGFVCFYQDSTRYSDERFQFVNCNFTSDWIPPFRWNSRYSNDANRSTPAIVYGCTINADTTIADSLDANLLFYQSSESDNLVSSQLRARWANKNRRLY